MSSQPTPEAIAKAIALETAEDPDLVGDFIERIDLGDNVYDFRFGSHLRGYDDWQWAVSLYHDVELDSWTVNESSLVPTDGALMAPEWVPWKDRLQPSDLTVTDAMGTPADDSRLEEGFRKTEPRSEDVDEIVEEYRLSRHRVLSNHGRTEVAQRWYDGPHGPKSLSTKTAKGLTCETCAFFIPLKGDLNMMFGVCANKWSPDDGRVVSLDHGCGEHSEIEPPEPESMWPDRKPTFDDLHIDVMEPTERDEVEQVEVIENLEVDGTPVTEIDDDDDEVPASDE